MAAGAAAAERVVLWFKGTDLRLHDNVLLERAAQLVKKCKAEVVPLYCFDPRQLGTTPWGNRKMGNLRAQFLLESVLDLKAGLRGVGSDLVVHLGKPEDAIPGLLPTDGPTTSTVLTHADVTGDELRVERGVARALQGRGKLERLWGNSLYQPDDLPFARDMSDLPDVFTHFRNKVEHKVKVRKEALPPQKGDLPLPPGLEQGLLDFSVHDVEDINKAVPPEAPALRTVQMPEGGVLNFHGGEQAALKRLHHYLWDTDAAATYFDTRNGMLGPDYSTKLSPWLAHGCISARRVYWELKRYEAERTSNKSTYWIVFEMLWRDFFRFFALKHGNAIFYERGISGRPVEWKDDPQLLQRWKAGTLGMPLVDANMRELAATGFMSNRGRQNVASYLALDLGLDWREGSDWFEANLIDYDVHSNWGNWVSAAGLTGGRINHFNITKQSKDYDADGNYIRHWVPELKEVPGNLIHEPWKMSRADAEKYSVQIGLTYPNPPAVPKYQRDNGGGHGGGRGRGRGRQGRGRGKNHSNGGRHPREASSRSSNYEQYG